MANFRRKIPEVEKEDIAKFTNYSLHKERTAWKDSYVQFVSVDPAIKHYAFRIERRHKDGRIETVVFWKRDFSESSNRYADLIRVLDMHVTEYAKTHVFIVEKQMRENYQSVRIAQQTLVYFSMVTRNSLLRPDVIEINNGLKYTCNDAPTGRTESYKKKWSVEKVQEILVERKDDFGLRVLREHVARTKDKGDDLADTILQINAYCQLNNIVFSPEVKPKIVIKKREDSRGEIPKKKIVIIRKDE